MKIKEMKTILSSNKYDNCECNFKLKSKPGQPPVWFKEFATEVFDRLDKIDKFIVEQKKFNKKQEQFNQKQQQFNQYVLDVFKRNNLK